MYKIRNVTGGIFPMDLEVGSVMLQSTGNRSMIDLDGVCSRKWIRNNTMLHSLIARSCLELVHDSEAGVPTQPVHQVVRNEMKVPVLRKDPDAPKIIDFSKVSEEQDTLPIEDVFEDITFELEEETPVVCDVELLDEEDREVDAELESAFKVGDFIIPNSDKITQRMGAVGTITEGPDEQGLVHVTWHHGGMEDSNPAEGTYYAEELALYAEEDTTIFEEETDSTTCEVCGRTFKSERGKKVHMRTHKD